MRRPDRAPPRTEATTQEIVRKLEEVFATVANELNVPVDRVRNIARRKPPSKERQRRDQAILRLRRKGFSNQEIAKVSGWSVGRVAGTAHQLIREGRLEPLRRGVRPWWRDLKSERVQTVIEMKKRRAPLEEIGRALGRSRQRVSQIIARVTQEHGENVFKSDEPLWSTKEAAAALGVSPGTVTRLCANGAVPCRRRGLQEDGSYLIDQAGMKRLRRHPEITGKKACVICGGTFVAKGRGWHSALTCSQKCRKELVSQRRASYAARDPTLDSLKGWRKEVWLALRRHRIPEDEEWLSISGAMRRSGLTLTVVWWLQHRRIVTTRTHPTKTWGGRPVVAYAASEMEIVRRVHAAHH